MPAKKKSAGALKCKECGQSFSLPMHLGRHMATRHGQVSVKSAMKAATGGKRGRPSGLTVRLGLRSMSLDQLLEVINLAKAEASQRIAQLQVTLR